LQQPAIKSDPSRIKWIFHVIDKHGNLYLSITVKGCITIKPSGGTDWNPGDAVTADHLNGDFNAIVNEVTAHNHPYMEVLDDSWPAFSNCLLGPGMSLDRGCACFDYDGDADPDLLLINGDDWPWHESRSLPRPTMKLYRNDGAGAFSDVTGPAGLAEVLYGMGVAVGDYDNDGDRDLYVTAWGANRLFRNDGGRFTDVTAEAGVAGGDEAWSTSAAFFDIDRDGVWPEPQDLIRYRQLLNGPSPCVPWPCGWAEKQLNAARP